jgi:hypothetical protein
MMGYIGRATGFWTCVNACAAMLCSFALIVTESQLLIHPRFIISLTVDDPRFRRYSDILRDDANSARYSFSSLKLHPAYAR